MRHVTVAIVRACPLERQREPAGHDRERTGILLDGERDTGGQAGGHERRAPASRHVAREGELRREERTDAVPGRIGHVEGREEADEDRQMRRPAERRGGRERPPRERARERIEQAGARRVDRDQQPADGHHRLAEGVEKGGIQVEAARRVAGVEVEVGALAAERPRDLEEDQALVFEQDAVVDEGGEIGGRGDHHQQADPVHAGRRASESAMRVGS